MAQPDGNWQRFQYIRKTSEIIARARQAEQRTAQHANTFLFGRWHNTKQVRHHMALWLIGVGILIIVVVAQFFVLRGTYSTRAAVPGGTYAEGVVGRIESLNPLYTSSGAEQSLTRLLFSSLFTYDSTGALQSDIATGYKLQNDGKRYRVSIRTDAKWSDGQKLTADDIIFTINAIKRPAVGSPLYASWRDVTATKVDAATIDFTLPAAYAPFPHALTFAILPKHILQDVAPNVYREHDFSQHPTTSGPFALRYVQTVPGSDGQRHRVAHLVRNSHYYRGAPKLERFQLHAYRDANRLAEALATREINAASGLPLSKATELDKTGSFNIIKNTTSAGIYALFNTTGDALQHAKVRQALQRGTNVAAARNAVATGLQPIDTPFVRGQVPTGDINKPSYNVQEANKLLDEAGYSERRGGVRMKNQRPLQLRVVLLKSTDYEKVAANLRKQWAALGVQAVVRTVDPNDPTQSMASSVLQPRDYDVLIHELTIGADPDVYAYWHSSQAVARGLNFTNYSNGVASDALASARARSDGNLRNAKYQSFLRQWYKDAPAIGLYQSAAVYASTKGTTAVQPGEHYVAAQDRYNNVAGWMIKTADVYRTP